MSNKANPTYIGLFVVGALALAILAVIVFGRGRIFAQNEEFVLYFQDSINGLDIGAPVKFKGVRIGQVRRIYIRYNQLDESPHVPVIIEIDVGRLKNYFNVNVDLNDPVVFKEQVEVLGLRARLQQQSFVTGLLFIELDYLPGTTPVFVQNVPPGQKGMKEIPTLPSGLVEVMQTVNKVVTQIGEIPFADIGIKLNDILTKLDDGISQIQFKELNDGTLRVVNQLDSILHDRHLRSSIENMNMALQEGRDLLQNLNSQINPISQDLRTTSAKAQEVLQATQTLVEHADAMLEPNSLFRYRLDYTLKEFSSAARSIRFLADYIERNPNAFITGKQE